MQCCEVIGYRLRHRSCGIRITCHFLVARSVSAVRMFQCSQHRALRALLSRLALLRLPACSSLIRNRHVVTADRWHIELLINSVCHRWLYMCICVLCYAFARTSGVMYHDAIKTTSHHKHVSIVCRGLCICLIKLLLLTIHSYICVNSKAKLCNG